MESGLRGRNNKRDELVGRVVVPVSMESGLRGRNNGSLLMGPVPKVTGLNGVRPKRPEQSDQLVGEARTVTQSQWSPA